MRFILRLTLVISVICAVLIVVATWIGHRQPIPAALAALHLDVCDPPCWLGITPGTTSMAEAQSRIIRFVEKYHITAELTDITSENSTYLTYYASPNRIPIKVHIEGADYVVYRIYLQVDGLRLGDYIAFMGRPNSIQASYGDQYLEFKCGDISVVGTGLLSPDTFGYAIGFSRIDTSVPCSVYYFGFGYR